MKARFENLKVLLSERVTLYPVLTGILFLVNELRNNSGFYTIKENVLLVVIIIGFSFIVDSVSRKFVKSKVKAALIAVLFIFINLFYQDIYLIISSIGWVMNILNSTTANHPEIIIIPVLSMIWLAFTFIIQRTIRSLNGLNLYLNGLIIFFILFELAKWLIYPVPKIKLVDSEPFPISNDFKSVQKPDIYYIILDAYTSSESLKKYWSYDNSMFEDSLKQLGFFVAKKSKPDYIYTSFCLASYLNSSLLILDSTKHYTEKNLLQLIRNNRLFYWLSANNYRCYNYSIYNSFGSKKYYNPFTYNHFLGRTIWYTNFIKFYHFVHPSSRISYTNLRIFKKLGDLSKDSLQKQFFVYAHVMMPHFPFSFDRNGKPFSKSDSSNDEKKYLEQLIYTNTLTLKTLNNILTSSRPKPIIIIQGDHGYRYLKNISEVERLQEAHSIFFAIYSPNDMVVSDTIKPLNVFKKVVNKINDF